MFRKKDDKLDITKLNEILRLTRKLLPVLLFLFVISAIVLATYILKAWNILMVIKTLFGVLAPFFIGLIIAWLFDPVVTFLKKKGVSRVLGTILVYLLLIGIIILLVWLLFPMLMDQINDFVSSIPSVLNDTKGVIQGIFDRFSAGGELDVSSVSNQVFASIEEFGSSLATKLPEMSIQFLKSLASGGMTLLLGFMFGFYLLFDFHNIEKHLLHILPKGMHKDAIYLGKRINGSLRHYVQGTLLIMFLVFVFQSIGLSLAGMKAPLLFGMFCAITNVIPYVGPYIGGIPAVIVGFSIRPLTGILCLISIVVVQLVESNILQPVVMSKAMKLHPVTIMVGLLLFGHFFGILGMILATPIMSILKTIFVFADQKIDFHHLIHGEEEHSEN